MDNQNMTFKVRFNGLNSVAHVSPSNAAAIAAGAGVYFNGSVRKATLTVFAKQNPDAPETVFIDGEPLIELE